MSNLYLISIMMILTGNCAYQLTQKFINTAVNPLVSLTISYFVGFVLTFILIIYNQDEEPLFSVVQKLNWASYALGITLVVIDAGFILAYRSGWNLSLVSVLYNVIPIMLLVPIGAVFFKDQLSLVNVAGVAVTLSGIIMVNWGKT